jgi:uncharacterized protein YbjT (DUF2867 family)
MILVTGATGNVGTHLVPYLLKADQRVRVLVRDPAKVSHLSGHVDVAVGDLDAPDTVDMAMDGVRAVYLVAFETHQVAHVVEAATRAAVERVVRQSTIEAGTVPALGPGTWHREQEVLVERSGLAWTHLRPTMMMVNTIDWWGESIRTAGAVFFPGGQGRVSPVDPADVAAVACAVLTTAGHAGHAYEVTGPELLTIAEMVATLSQVLETSIRYVDVPEAAAVEWMAGSGLPRQVAVALGETLGGLRTNRFATVADTVERLTGRPPRSYAAWCRANADAFRVTSDA